MGTRHFPDPRNYRLPFDEPARAALPPVKVKRRFRAGFLRGPISWPWLNRAAQLPGCALHVAIAIRLWTGIKKTNCIVLPTSELTRMGVGRHAAYRAVLALEEADLVTVTRHAGHKTRVCVIEIDE